MFQDFEARTVGKSAVLRLFDSMEVDPIKNFKKIKGNENLRRIRVLKGIFNALIFALIGGENGMM